MTTTAIAPTNIAIVKYWGKNPAFENLLLPTKSSLSFTVKDLYTKTTVTAKKGSGQIDFTLNKKKILQSMKEYEYVEEFLRKVSQFFPFILKYDYKIISENNFPTAAGFASSASGFAALIKALAGELKEFENLRSDDRQLSALARLGSGSATRSIPSKGGFVIWHRGLDYTEKVKISQIDAHNCSYAETLFEPSHWPELVIIYAKVGKEEKKIKSRAGMRTSIDTNPLYGGWVKYEEEEMNNQVIEAMKAKNFPKLAELIMKASNNLHQICLGTYPPIIYLTQKSMEIIDAISELNKNGIKAAYTFDAGPNPVIFCIAKNKDEVMSSLTKIMGSENLVVTSMGPGARYESKNLG